MKIVFYEIEDWEAEYIKNKLPGFNLEFVRGVCSSENLPPEDADIVSPFVASKIDAQFFAAAPSVKFVATRSTGYDHINLEAAKAHGVVVSNVPTYGESTVAEFTFALILELSRKLYPAIKRVREDGWFSFEGLRGFDLKGKTLGVVGTGRIGASVIEIAKGFTMNVVAYDVHQNEVLAKQYGFVYVPLEELLGQSDVITLHVPYMPATHHLLNLNNFKLIKPGCILVNTARGALVETEALVATLRSGQLAGAALDVLEEEGFINDEATLLASGHPQAEQMRTLLADHALMGMDNVIITPHNAFNTTEAIQRILDTTVENIQAFVNGKPVNVVT
jgi:D-lactate dehydrogenase